MFAGSMASSSTRQTAEPLRSLEELQSWTAQNLSLDALENVASIALLQTEKDAASEQLLSARRSGADTAGFKTEAAQNEAHRPRLLVCHDLQGGYQDDKWLHGGSNPNAYRIWHWHLIDVFVYFSHHLVTIPPAGWTDAAHQHGVKVLGTFITEWDAGAAICHDILSSLESARYTADQLVAIAVHHKFDGWLLNIENKVDPEQIPTLVEFVRYLTKKMHAANALGEVIWYDSVTTEGELEWQDGLTPLNAPFFFAADGLFVNYTWKAGTPDACAVAANGRAPDVFMGVDVFGRGTFGGGGYHADTALAAARSAGVSAALFAPAWVIENPHEAGPNFEHAQEKFWGLVQRCWPAARPAVTRVPFESDFNQGVGHFWCSDGVLESERPWNNLARQSVQPLHHAARLLSAQKRTTLEAGVCFESAFNGGSLYEIRGRLEKGDCAAVRLFDCSLELDPFQQLSASFTVSALPDCHVALLLRIRSSDGQNLTMVCSSSAVSAVSSEEVKAENTRKSYDHETALEEFKEAKDDTLGTRPGQPPETVRGSVDSVGVPEQSSAGRSGAPSEDGDPGGSSEHFERPAYNSRQEPGERPGEASVISPDSGWISGAQVESGNANSGRESRDVSWASLRRTTPHANGWRTLLFDATAGVAGRLTDVGLVCNVGGLLNERNLEGVWETMKAHTEDAWVYRERETQNGGEPAEDERGPSGPDERTVEDGSEQHSEGRKESNTTRGLLTDRASESLQLGEKQSSMGSNLGRRMLRGTGRDVESHEEIASFADGRAEVHSQDHAVTEEINGFRIQLGRIALQYEKEY